MSNATPVRLEKGDEAPEFTLPADNGSTVSLAGLRGKRVVLYFYPKAETPGCTTEACDFRDNLASLKGAGYEVFGVSPDPVAALEKWQNAESFGFPLLSDASHEVMSAYGVWGEKNSYGRVSVGVIRSTFVIDEQGRIELALYNVKATGHVAMLRKKLGIDA